MSGTADNHWASSDHSIHLELAHRIASDLGEPKENLDELIKFLTSASAKDLSENSTIEVTDNVFTIPFSPVIESEI